jgi:uncharacterized phage protein gp47/JayE
MISFSDLLTTKTLDDWKRAIVNTATLVGLKTQNWAEGGYTRTLVALFAQLYTTAGNVVRLIAASGFLDTAEGDWLTLLAKNLFNVERIEATFAKAADGLTITNGGGGLYVFDAGDVIVAHNVTGKTYRNTTGGTLSPGIGQTLTLDLEAEEAGSGSNAGIGTITTLVTTFLGLTCSNPVALAGIDGESDEDLRQRCRDSLAALALGGIANAYDFFAKSAVREDGTAIGVTRVKVMPAPGDGTVDVFIASASGAVAIDDVAIVQADFDEHVTPYGFDATAISASNVSITVPCEIWIPASLGLAEADAQTLVFDALEAYVQTLPIGGVVITPATGKVYWRALLGIVEGSIPGMLKAELDNELDTSIADGEVPVWGGDLIDTVVNQVVGA